MKVTYNWIKDFVEVDISPEQLADKLTMAGIEVKAVEPKDGDFVFEIEITSNRPDWLSVLGIAREVAAVTGKKLKQIPSPAKAQSASSKDSVRWNIEIEDAEDCPLYTAKVLTGVVVGPSPEWLRKRLEIVGCRSVNNVVDITNYCLYELGEPLHAFDCDTLASGMIAVRRARAGEGIVTIDGQQRALNPSVLVIADTRGPVAVAGVMGGKKTEVTEKTRNVLLEAAIFRPVVVRRGRQSLGLQSDASYRFERGIDPEIVDIASMRCAALMQELCGARCETEASSPACEAPVRTVTISPASVNQILGLDVSADRIKTILETLGFSLKAKGGDGFSVTVPSHRQDVNAEIDLVEEVARIHGFENTPVSLPAVKLQVETDSTYRRITALKSLLTGLGLDEVVTYSMVDRPSLAGFWDDEPALAMIANPLSEEQEVLRPVLMPGVAKSVAYNLRQQQDHVALFEIAKTYQRRGGKLHEDYQLCIAICGAISVWLEQQKKHMTDTPGFLHLKGIVSQLFDRSGAAPCGFVSVDPGRVDIVIAGKVIGAMRRFSKEALDRLAIKNKDVYALEMPLNIILKAERRAIKFEPISRYPGISRDISIVIPDDIETAQVIEQIQQHGGEFLQRVAISDFYKGKPIPEGHKNLTVSCFYRSNTRTLQEDEVNAGHGAIVDFLKQRFGATIR
ncbi:MAG: phenylalanine--tRNA ligase subunit beta [Candidatus Omnitrophota bacterium]